MTAVLAVDGLLNVEPDPAGGNRRRLSLTDKGTRLVTSVRHDFEDRLARFVEQSGVPYAQYTEHTERLLSTLDRMEQEKAT